MTLSLNRMIRKRKINMINAHNMIFYFGILIEFIVLINGNTIGIL